MAKLVPALLGVLIVVEAVRVGIDVQARQAIDDILYERLLTNPSLPTCPTGNCPAPPSPPVLSSQFIHASTTKGASQAEWLSNIGLFVKTGNPNGQKVTQYLGVMQQEGAGSAWALNTDAVRNAGLGGPNAFGGFEGSGKAGRPGAIGVQNGTIGYELDFTNWDANSSPGVGAFTVGQFIHVQSTFTSLAAIYFDAKMAESNKNAGWSDGLLFNGDRVVKNNTIFDGTHSTNSLTVAGHHVVGLNTTLANSDLRAVAIRSGQTICLNETQNCVSWAHDKLYITNRNGEQIFSVDEHGNARFKGHVYTEYETP